MQIRFTATRCADLITILCDLQEEHYNAFNLRSGLDFDTFDTTLVQITAFVMATRVPG